MNLADFVISLRQGRQQDNANDSSSDDRGDNRGPIKFGQHEESGKTTPAEEDENEESRDLESLLNEVSDSEEEVSIDKAEETERAVRQGLIFPAVAAVLLCGFNKVMSILSCLMPSSPQSEVAEVVADDVAAGTLQGMGLQSSAYSSSSNSFYGAGGFATGSSGSGASTGATGTTAANTQ